MDGHPCSGMPMEGEFATKSDQTPNQGVSHRAHWSGTWGINSGVSNDASGVPGAPPEYSALPSHAGLCEGGRTVP